MSGDDRNVAAALDGVRHALQGLRFGTIEIVVHDARVVCIERCERVRLDNAQERQTDGTKTATGHTRRSTRTSTT